MDDKFVLTNLICLYMKYFIVRVKNFQTVGTHLKWFSNFSLATFLLDTFAYTYFPSKYPRSSQRGLVSSLIQFERTKFFASTSRLLPIPVDSIAQWEAGGGLEDSCGLEEIHLYEIYRQKFKVQAELKWSWSSAWNSQV